MKIIKPKVGKKKNYKICNECPCLNADYEFGSACNLDFCSQLKWIEKNTGKVVEDTPEMRSHQNDFDLLYISYDCKLVEIKVRDEGHENN